MTDQVASLLPNGIIHLDQFGEQHSVFVITVTESMMAHEVFGGVERAFRSGVNAVWVVFPNTEQVYVFTSPTAVRVLTRADELTAEPVVPGFRMALADLFPLAEPTP